MKNAVFALLLASAIAASAAQSVGNVVVSRDAERRLITVSYTLAEPGIVTVAFKRDGVTIPEARYASVAGDVNKYVAATAPGKTRTMRWQTDLDWPDTAFDGSIDADVTAWTTNNPPDYVVLDLATMTNSAPYAGARYYTSTNALPGGLFDSRYFSEKLVMRKMPAAGVVWRMGSPDGEVGRSSVDGLESRHRVKLTQDYYIGVFETTYGQSAYMFPGTSYANNRVDSGGAGDPRCAQGNVAYYYLRTPEKVGLSNYDNPESWLIIGALRDRMGVKLNLPTEAQWEFACRSGTGAPFHNGYSLPNTTTYGPAKVREAGWIFYKIGQSIADDEKPYGPRPVGLKKPNAWGLYDVIGNVAEFCYDPYGAYVVEADDGISENPVGGNVYDSSKKRVLRGGYFNQSADKCRSAARNPEGNAGAYVGYGFRLVCPVTLY